MSGLGFADPWLLLLLPLAAAAAWQAARRRRHGDGRIRLPRAATSIPLGRSRWVRLDRALPWMRGLALGLFVVGLARPQAGSRIEEVTTYGVDIVLAIDVSQSMQAEDFQPDNRLAVAQRVAQGFVAGRPADRIGLVTFGSVATTRCPLTLDHDMLDDFLAGVDFAPPEQQATAIGMGLATAVNRLRDSQARSKVVVLVTDGANTAGTIGPLAAAAAARAEAVKVYTVGVGSNREVPFPLPTAFGTRRQLVQIEFDEELLRQIAATTNGRYWQATDAAALQQVFETIDQLERTKTESRVRMLYTELFGWVLVPALGLLVAERGLGATRLRRLP